MPLVDEIISQLSSSDPEEFHEGILMARTMLETRRRVTTDSSSEATALPVDNLDDSRVQLIVHTLQLLLCEEDSSRVGMAAFALEYSYRVDLLEPLATLIDRFPGDGYVLLQSVVTVSRLIATVAELLESGKTVSNAQQLIRHGCQAVKRIAESGVSDSYNVTAASAMYLDGLRQRLHRLGLDC